MTLANKTITVFGGTGFLGRHVIWQLARTGATIRVPTRLRERAFFLRPAGDVGQVIPMACDINDDASVAWAVSGASHVVNLAGIMKEKGKSTFGRLHAEAAERIARLSREAGAETLVHVSTLGASADAPSQYARSKAEGESRAIHAFSRTVILRPAAIFGPEDKFFNLMARQKCFALPGGGRTKFQPVYVGDVARAVLNVVTAAAPEALHGQIYELAGPGVFTLRELCELTARVTHREACLISLPFSAASALSYFPGVPLTADQVRYLKSDNVAGAGAQGLAALGVTPTAVESVLPSYLGRYRPGGQFGEKRQAS